MTTVEYRSRYDATPEALFAFHERPGALEALTPPWERVRVVSREGRAIEAGARAMIESPVSPAWLRCTAVHTRDIAGVELVARAECGPMRE